MAKKTKTQPKARKTITSNNLADLSKLVQALEIDDENPENQQKPSALDKKIIYNEFQNSTYTLVSPMAYLIGIDKENFGEENARPFLLKSYEELDAHKEARIIRNLCRIRTAMERNYPAIVNEFRMSFRNIGSVPNQSSGALFPGMGEVGLCETHFPDAERDEERWYQKSRGIL